MALVTADVDCIIAEKSMTADLAFNVDIANGKGSLNTLNMFDFSPWYIIPFIVRHSGSSVNSIWKRVIRILDLSNTADLSILNCATLIIVFHLVELSRWNLKPIFDM